MATFTHISDNNVMNFVIKTMEAMLSIQEQGDNIKVFQRFIASTDDSFEFIGVDTNNSIVDIDQATIFKIRNLVNHIYPDVNAME